MATDIQRLLAHITQLERAEMDEMYVRLMLGRQHDTIEPMQWNAERVHSARGHIHNAWPKLSSSQKDVVLNWAKRLDTPAKLRPSY